MMNGCLVLNVHSHSGDIGECFLLLADIGVECIKTSMEPFIHYLFSVVAFKEIMSSFTIVSEKIAQAPLM